MLSLAALKILLLQADGALRQLKMLSINGPYSLSPLLGLMTVFSSHRVPLTSLRFEIEDVYCEIFAGFGPDVLEDIFQKFPALEELCLDQEDDDYWPMRWVSE
jgi:hypothetical protein